jgi:hypothetical protein
MRKYRGLISCSYSQCKFDRLENVIYVAAVLAVVIEVYYGWELNQGSIITFLISEDLEIMGKISADYEDKQ